MKKIFIAISIILSYQSTFATEPYEQSLPKNFKLENLSGLYLSSHDKYEASEKKPLLIYLHGVGMRGKDLQVLKMMFKTINSRTSKYQFQTIVPLLEKGTWEPEEMNNFLDHLKKTYQVNSDRIYIMGFSLGGGGVGKWAEKYPKSFSAVVPIAGWLNKNKINKDFLDLGIWSFIGTKDPNYKQHIQYVNSLKKIGADNVRQSVYENTGHNISYMTVKQEDLYIWLNKQSRSHKIIDAGHIDQLNTEDWKYVSFNSIFTNPRIVVTPVYDTSVHPSLSCLIKDVSKDGFYIKYHRLDNQTDVIGQLEATYLVAEDGVYNSAEHGIKMEAGSLLIHDFDSKDNGWHAYDLETQNTYKKAVILGSSQSNNFWSAFWSYHIKAKPHNQIRIGAHIGEGQNNELTHSKLDYIIIEQGTYESKHSIIKAHAGGKSINGSGLRYYQDEFSSDYASLSIASMRGPNGGFPVLNMGHYNLGDLLYIDLQEDQIQDSETSHTREKVSYLLYKNK